MTIVPAEPGTTLFRIDPDAEAVPVVAWEQGSSGGRAWPVFPVGKRGMDSGEAIWFPSAELLVDPVWNRNFESLDAWREAFEDEKPYEPGKAPGVSGPDGQPPASMKKAPAGPQAETEEAPVATNIEWGKKVLKNRSWWHFNTAGEEFLFEVEGGDPCPKDERVEKITRTAFYELRKALAVKRVLAGVTEGEDGEDQEEVEADSDEEEDDDDYGDLI